MAMIGLRYDLRAPSWGSATHAELYAACLDQARWGDERVSTSSSSPSTTAPTTGTCPRP
jgi:hypothetical protein